MSKYTNFLRTLVLDTFGQDEGRAALNLANRPYRQKAVFSFDETIGGASVARLEALISKNKVSHGDRDIFRPLQYCAWEFREFGVWSTRQVVYMSSLHLESLVKRVSETPRLPLGTALRKEGAKRRIAPGTYEKIGRLTTVYNSAKHDMDHEFGTHLFSEEDALLAYFAARKLGIRLYELVNLKTDIRLFRRAAS